MQLAAPQGAWLVGWRGDEAVACGGVRLLSPDAAVPLLVARDQRVLTLALTLPAVIPPGTGAIALKAAAAPAEAPAAVRNAWLAA